MTQHTPNTAQKLSARPWFRLIALSTLSTYFYVFMEWLFFATKQSSLSQLGFLTSLQILLTTQLILALILILFLWIVMILALLLRKPLLHSYLLFLGKSVPAIVLSIAAMMMLDNFTYTVFGKGIVTAPNSWKWIYIIGLLLVLWRLFVFTHKTIFPHQKSARNSRIIAWTAISLVSISVIWSLPAIIQGNAQDPADIIDEAIVSKRPNIIILGSDGLNADHMSVYGYGRDTTPFLSKLAETSMMAENAFPNASSTTASTTSVLTGKEPIITGVLRYPDILTGANSFEHLPGILKQAGYITIEIGTPYYVDAYTLNLLDGFDVANTRSMNSPMLTALRQVLGMNPSPYFLWTMQERVIDRLTHIFYIKEMLDPYALVTETSARFNDQQRVSQIVSYLDDSEAPFFIFVHMMDTHGPNFSPREQLYSAGQSEPDRDDIYDDAITGFDHYVQEIYTQLEDKGLLDNTILIIYTDHGLNYTTNVRVPLIIRFPAGEHATRIENNVQNIDIPVTLLAYMGIEKPDWMDGTSLLDGETPRMRNIYSITAGSPKDIKPPFYQIRNVRVIICNKWYRLDVKKNEWATGTVYRHTARCQPNSTPSEEEVRKDIIKYLENYGYEVSSLKE